MMANLPALRRRQRGSTLILSLLMLLMLATGGMVAAQPVDRTAAPPSGRDHNHPTEDPGFQNPAPPPPPGTVCQPGTTTVADCAPGQTVQRPGPRAASGPLGMSTGGALSSNATAKTLILYDTSSQYGYLGELYATSATNLSSHFGNWSAKPVVSYQPGDLNGFDLVIYIGSTYDEQLPDAFLSDVLMTNTTVMWMFGNIWQLADKNLSTFQSRYGWDAREGASVFDLSSVATVRYEGINLSRYAPNGAGIINPQILDASKITTLATAVRADNTTFPWAIRSANLIYLGEIPFTYTSEEDRYLAFADMLFDLLAPTTPTRHRAMVRLEDLNPMSDPAKLKQVADYLYSQNVPFGFGLSPVFADPLGKFDATPSSIPLKDRPDMVEAINYLLSHGGVMIEHGYTHQWDNQINPYTGMTGDDFEFYRVTENPDHTLKFVGPVPEDSPAWAQSRIDGSNQAIAAAGFAKPTIFEFPHYTGSAVDYQVVNANFAARWERSVYFTGVLSGSPVSYQQIYGQMFPYAVRDVYGTVVLPENLGNIVLEPFYQFPTRSSADLIRAAEKNLVVRDGFAAFYYHPDFIPLSYLQETVSGIKQLGYTFVGPTDILPSTPPAPSFVDVPTDYWAYDQITQFAQRGITTGCGDDEQGQRLFCPERGVTRAEMAVFIMRTLGAPVGAPTGQTFADVPADYWAAAQIEAFLQLGITTGCGDDEQGRRLFCPDRGVTRAEMAAFLDRAKGQPELFPAVATFADVPPSYWAFGWVERFFTLGITTGCGEDENGNRVYCPDRGVTRAEMAVFIIRAYPAP